MVYCGLFPVDSDEFENLRDALGRAVHVQPMKPVLKAPGSMLLRLKYDGLLSNFAFKFNLRRYSVVSCR